SLVPGAVFPTLCPLQGRLHRPAYVVRDRRLHRQLYRLLQPRGRRPASLGPEPRLFPEGTMKLALCIALLSPAAWSQVRVEPRALVKEGSVFLSGGGTWLERHDQYSSPGLTLIATWYLREDDG